MIYYTYTYAYLDGCIVQGVLCGIFQTIKLDFQLLDLWLLDTEAVATFVCA